MTIDVNALFSEWSGVVAALPEETPGKAAALASLAVARAVLARDKRALIDAVADVLLLMKGFDFPPVAAVAAADAAADAAETAKFGPKATP